MPKFGDSRFDFTLTGQTCLHKAVKEGHPKVVRYLIEEGGFDPNLQDPVRRNTLFTTVYICVATHCDMQGKLMSFERSTDFSGIQDVSIRRSSSVVIQNLGKRDIK